MTPEQLRASILQQAMEGKLVEQDPNDEPASVLLEKIAKEKARLIKEKKIKRTKKLPEITDDEKPFKIPDSWEWIRMSELSSAIGDGLHGTPTYTNKGKYAFINGSNLKNGQIILTPETKYINEDEFEKIKSPINNNTVLISINGTLGNLAKLTIKNVSLGKSAGFITLITDLVLEYIYKFLQSPTFKNFYESKYTGTTIKNIPLKALRECPVPIPPLVEQKRIVAKLDQLMPLVDEYAEAYDKLKKLDDGFNDKLKQSLLQYAMEGKLVKQDPNDEPASVLLEKIAEEKARLIKEKKIKRTKKLPEITDDEKPFEIPDSWEWVRIGNLVNIYTGLSYNKSKLQEQSNDMVRVLRGGNINGSNYTVDLYDDDVMIDRKYLAKNNLLLKRGQLLTPSVTSDKQLGKIAIVSDDYNDIVAGGFIFNIVPFIDNEVFSKYFMFVFSSRFIKQQLLNAANKSGQAFYNVSKTKFQKLTLPIPPLAEQKRIVAKINQLMATIH